MSISDSSQAGVDLIAIGNPISSHHGEHVEQILSLQSEVTAAKFLQCGHIISHNLKAVAAALDELMRLVCGVVADDDEADMILPMLKNARDTLVIIMTHVDSAIWSIDEAHVMIYRCTQNDGEWDKLPIHLGELQDHNRHVHELWPKHRNYLNHDLLTSLLDHFYSLDSILPHAALWAARLTRSAQFFPRLHVWGLLPSFIADICAALDPVPQLLDDVERYAVDMGERLQIVVSDSSRFPDEEGKRIQPVLRGICETWASYYDTSHGNLHGIKHLEPSEYLRFHSRHL